MRVWETSPFVFVKRAPTQGANSQDLGQRCYGSIVTGTPAPRGSPNRLPTSSTTLTSEGSLTRNAKNRPPFQMGCRGGCY